MRQTQRLASALVVLALAGGCVSSAQTEARISWGQEALDFFQAWGDAYTANDAYGVLDFYTPSATIEDRTGVFRAATPLVPTVLQGNTAKLTRKMLGVHLGADQAITLVVWPDFLPEHGAVVSTIEDGFIASESILLDAATLERSLRASPEILATYESAFEDLAIAWTSGDPRQLTPLYDPDATISDALTGLESAGHTAIVQLATGQPASWAIAKLPEEAGGSEPVGNALFLDPVEYSADPQRAVGVFEVTRHDACTYRMAVLWRFEDGIIVDEQRYPDVESFRQCDGTRLVDGWWTGREVPGPRDQVETGVITSRSANVISVRNGTARLNGLVSWALDRYAVAGLTEPRMDTVTFEPTRRCEGVAGRVVTAGTERDLVLCIDESDLCPDAVACAGLALGARVGMLHELAHAWMLDEVDDATQSLVLELSGRARWIDDAAPWEDRGVEYSAQIMAWGLADEPIGLVELGGPPCEETSAIFEILTGTNPLTPGCAP